MPAPIKRMDVNEEVAELERVAKGQGCESDAVRASRENALTPSPSPIKGEGSMESYANPKIIVLEDLLREAEEGELAETVSFSEMQKIIGIKR